jgi:hypothetical protein
MSEYLCCLFERIRKIHKGTVWIQEDYIQIKLLQSDICFVVFWLHRMRKTHIILVLWDRTKQKYYRYLHIKYNC